MLPMLGNFAGWEWTITKAFKQARPQPLASLNQDGEAVCEFLHRWHEDRLEAYRFEHIQSDACMKHTSSLLLLQCPCLRTPTLEDATKS